MAAIVAAPPADSNVGSLSERLRGSDVPIPDAFVQPEKLRPSVPHDGYQDQQQSQSLPIVDLSPLWSSPKDSSSSSRAAVAAELASASREWGFVQVSGHGIPEELLARLRAQGRAFFQLPAEEKERASLGLFQGYEGRHGYIPAGVPWSETLTLQLAPLSNVEPVMNKLHNNANLSLSSTILEYGERLHQLGMIILELLAESLGLDTDFFSRNFREKHSAGMRLNYYPPCPQPSMALGLGAHADPNCLTLLYQDEVGGLQIQKDGKWIAVKPQIDSIVLNIGDSLQAWSNGNFQSVQHRAVVNGSRARLSVAFFHSPDDSAAMEVPPALVDDEHPLLYRPFTWSEYLHIVRRILGGGSRNSAASVLHCYCSQVVNCQICKQRQDRSGKSRLVRRVYTRRPRQRVTGSVEANQARDELLNKALYQQGSRNPPSANIIQENKVSSSPYQPTEQRWLIEAAPPCTSPFICKNDRRAILHAKGTVMYLCCVAPIQVRS